jgi:peptide/nickel transport system permease protein
MLRFLLRRLLTAGLTLVAISITVFALFFLGPADPAASMCGTKACTAEQHDRIQETLGLDRPVTVQYADYMKGIFAGRMMGKGQNAIKCPAPCLGLDFRTSEQVSAIIGRTFPVTASIVFGGAVVYLIFGIATGMFAAIRRGTVFDRLSSGASLVFASTQIFFLGALLLLILVYTLGWLPGPGYTSPFDNPFSWISGMLLPWLTLGLINSAAYSRLSRAQMIETLSEDFVRTARAKGASVRSVYFRHALRAAITPIVTIAGIDIGAQLGGTAITETTFSLQGMGKTALKAVGDQNLAVVMAVVLIGALAIVVANMIVDVMYAVIDPRVKLGSEAK